jgi:hypothetical protein
MRPVFFFVIMPLFGTKLTNDILLSIILLKNFRLCNEFVGLSQFWQFSYFANLEK